MDRSLADQLYATPTHFLLELIQNSDDNNYSAGSEPSVTFDTSISTATSRKLRVDCNEVGFTRQNIKAICSIGQSTKKTQDRIKGFIGEKGIGFKSVFKVADVVHISSGPFQFKLDRRETLGMIAPILEGFPRQYLAAGQTQTLLHLNSSSDLKIIDAELDKIRPELLIFLRKLSRIRVHTAQRNLIYAKITTKSNEPYLGETVGLVRGEEPSQIYIIVRHSALGLPKDERRLGIQESEVVLAFPVQVGGVVCPKIEEQYTYAYLPIAQYGFAVRVRCSLLKLILVEVLKFTQYLIQADFILTANREGIELSIDWNKHLRDEIVKAFRAAVTRLAAIPNGLEGKGVRYSWPKYLRDSGRALAFWSDLKREIIDDLKTLAILESRQSTQDFTFPTRVLFIPNTFRMLGEPLIEDAETAKKHLSFSYDTEECELLPELSLLGVEKMGGSQFVEELRLIIRRQGAKFLESKSKPWHSKLAATLYKVSRPQSLSTMPLVPLRNGEWVSSTATNLFLDDESSKLTVPNGIDIRIVDPEACKDHDRNIFYRWLGLVSCSQWEVCLMIVTLHQNTKDLDRPRDATVKDFVDDAFYLYNTPHFVDLSNIWLLDSKGLPGRGIDIYIDQPSVSPAMSKYVDDPESGIRMLHPEYFSRAKADNQESSFRSWLLDRLRVCTFPEFVRDRQLTKEFIFFAKNGPDKLLVYLRDNWGHYSPQFNSRFATLTEPDYAQTFSTALRKMLVRCTNGLTYPLEKTVLPLDDLKTTANLLPMVDIDMPYDMRWLNFKALGVATEKTLHLYLRQLKVMSQPDVFGTRPTKKSDVHDIYKELAARWTLIQNRPSER